MGALDILYGYSLGEMIALVGYGRGMPLNAVAATIASVFTNRYREPQARTAYRRAPSSVGS
jgi:hypothetical protein